MEKFELQKGSIYSLVGRPMSRRVPSLKQLLRNKDVAEFFRYVNEYDLRELALSRLEEKRKQRLN